ncbi:MAG: VRR-NUC domain-containing protein [Propionibacteriaceae bacterium]|nr:VRR-NUC domain-containing protein [Propionibacteriaceae bacterium]
MCWKFTSPGTQGVPDRVVILPGGRIGFVELKRTGALPRPIQVRRIAQLAALGVLVFVCDHTDQVRGVLDAIRAA